MCSCHFALQSRGEVLPLESRMRWAAEPMLHRAKNIVLLAQMRSDSRSQGFLAQSEARVNLGQRGGYPPTQHLLEHKGAIIRGSMSSLPDAERG